jgi:hypothetical protein
MNETIEDKNEMAMQKIYKRIVQTVSIEIKDLQKGKTKVIFILRERGKDRHLDQHRNNI